MAFQFISTCDGPFEIFLLAVEKIHFEVCLLNILQFVLHTHESATGEEIRISKNPHTDAFVIITYMYEHNYWQKFRKNPTNLHTLVY